MKIVNINEHLTCSCYAPMPDHGFNLLSMRKRETFIPEDLSVSRLIYLQHGRVKASYGVYAPVEVSAEQFFFIPKKEDMKIYAEEDSEMIVMTTAKVESICNKMTIPYLYNKLTEHTYSFKAHDATDMMSDFFGILKVYLVSGLRCIEMHRIKEQELFFLLRAGYSEEGLIDIFCPIIGQSEDFKSKVTKYRKNAKSVMQLAERMGMGIDNFKRAFRLNFEISPYQWMQQRKAEDVFEMLEADYPIKKVVQEFHFSSQSHMTRFCEKYFNKTPKTIKEEAKMAK